MHQEHFPQTECDNEQGCIEQKVGLSGDQTNVNDLLKNSRHDHIDGSADQQEYGDQNDFAAIWLDELIKLTKYIHGKVLWFCDSRPLLYHFIDSLEALPDEPLCFGSIPKVSMSKFFGPASKIESKNHIYPGIILATIEL